MKVSKVISAILLYLALSVSSYADEDDCVFRVMPNSVNADFVHSTLMQINECITDENETTTLIVTGLGGDPHAAAAFYDTVKLVKRGRIKVIGVGTIASAMVPIFMVGDERSMTPHALIIIHEGDMHMEAGSIVDSEIDEMYRVDKASDNVYESIIAETTGLPKVRVAEMVDDATIMTATEAVEYGFASKIEK